MFVNMYSSSRYLSLRFLAAHFLNRSIQSSTHDSVEDACAAVDLYMIYTSLVEEGKLQEALVNMYARGRDVNFLRDT
jgi:PAB-dependent poly(A)-specific ribonuclease subunit 2